MKLVYLDAYALNPGDLDWATLEALGDVTFYDRTAPDQIVERAKDADMLLVNKVRMNRETLAQLPNLRYIGVTATGYDIIDGQAAREQGITVTNVKGYSTESVAQHTFALLLELAYRTSVHASSVQRGDWASNPDFCYWKTPLVELAGKTLGVVGFGDIGRRVAEIGRAFAMNVIVNRRHTADTPPEGIRYVDISTLFAESDVVSLHCPMTAENKGFVNQELLAKMKKTAYFLNTSRGGLVTENDLAEALNKGTIAGAGLDVLTQEPPSSGNPLIGAKNCVLTPHIAWASFEARQRLLAITVENIKAFLAEKPQNVVN
ncbi:D-2-hydroxyacid dehydrogenase [Tellurirhabdus bombi]|uniref:D-2-hydroxyacid dehydrogenase n=1 Tax=Tellurirhabdus bombi TaxID=2907205 RepID=UPI001F18742B|nr:D-2-hydroxyacid dehydrogenase [Tellurirhabdus bombi]